MMFPVLIEQFLACSVWWKVFTMISDQNYHITQWNFEDSYHNISILISTYSVSNPISSCQCEIEGISIKILRFILKENTFNNVCLLSFAFGSFSIARNEFSLESQTLLHSGALYIQKLFLSKIIKYYQNRRLNIDIFILYYLIWNFY